MPNPLSKYDHLLEDNGPAAIVIKQWLKPVGGDVFFPPTYANPSQRKGDPPVYNLDRFGDGKGSSCVVDSIPAQANRIEPALGRISRKDGQSVRLVPKIVVKATIGEEIQEINLLEAGHRAADAVMQLSSLRDEISKAIKARLRGDSLPLAKLAPTSLVFGLWDSRETGAKVPRLLNSIIRARDVVEHRRSSQFFAAIDYEAAGVRPDKKEKKLSKVGMDDAPATFQHGGIEASGGIYRDASLNLCTLRDIKCADASKDEILQRYILGLALVALTFLDGKSLNLRQGCQLVADNDATDKESGKTAASHPKLNRRYSVNADGSESKFEIDAESAIDYAEQAAEAFGVGPDKEGIFDPKLAKAALKKSKNEEEAG